MQHAADSKNLEDYAATCADVNLCVENNWPVMVQLSELALTHENPEVAFNLVETAWHLAKVASGLYTHIEALSAISEHVMKGTAKGIALYANHLVNLIEHPVDTVKQDLLAPLMLAKAAFSTAFTVAFGEHEERTELWEQVKAISSHFYKNPDDIVATGSIELALF